MNIIQDFTNVNFTSNGMKQVRGIVLHSMAGTQAGSRAWFKNPQSQASAHYLISKTGEIVQMVRDTDMAWHAGVTDAGKVPDWAMTNPNWYCIGIELEDEKNPEWAYPEAQRKATKELVAFLMSKYNIQKDHVLLHKNLNPSRRSDPIGMFSFDWVFGTPSEPTVTMTVKEADAIRLRRDELYNLYNPLDQAGFSTVQKVNDIIEGHKSRATTLERERDEARSQTGVEKQKATNAVNDLAIKRSEWQVAEETLKARIEELSKNTPDLDKLNAEHQTQLNVERDSKEKAVKKMNEALIANSKLLAENDKLSKQTLDKYSLYELLTLSLKKIIPFLQKTKLK